MNDVTIRLLQPTEWREYRDLRLGALKDSPDAFGSTFQTSSLLTDDEWMARLNGISPLLDHPMIATADQKWVGLAWAMIDPPDDDVANLYQMWVAPSHRGKGIGRRLLNVAAMWARARGTRTMRLAVTCGNAPAEQLYLSAGFIPVGIPVPVRPGSALMEQSMTLDLHQDEQST